ncbi:MAG TPA: archaellin/type IV pilin N-terminal domain-containing protein [Thermoplasmata archaeon]|nr:archaellin/type IV pilin N-terminal domain-containing protein [Thermoplasmata archaeon]
MRQIVPGRLRSPRRRRGVSNIIATVMLVGLTVVAGSFLWGFRPSLPPTPSSISYQAEQGRTALAYGDGSDAVCVSGGSQPCLMPVIEIIITDHSPSFILLTSLFIQFQCNGTSYLFTSVASIEVDMSTGTVVSKTPPTLGQCGTWNPQGKSGVAFDRLLFFAQVIPGATSLGAGDILMLFTHQFEPPFCRTLPCWLTAAQFGVVGTQNKAYAQCPEPGYANGGAKLANGTYELIACDDDFHGAPYFCYTTVNACFINFVYVGTGVESTVRSIPLYGLSG